MSAFPPPAQLDRLKDRRNAVFFPRTFEVPAGDRSPAIDQAGDVTDGWPVLDLKPNERLTLSMQMRAP